MLLKWKRSEIRVGVVFSHTVSKFCADWTEARNLGSRSQPKSGAQTALWDLLIGASLSWCKTETRRGKQTMVKGDCLQQLQQCWRLGRHCVFSQFSCKKKNSVCCPPDSGGLSKGKLTVTCSVFCTIAEFTEKGKGLGEEEEKEGLGGQGGGKRGGGGGGQKEQQ